MSDDAELLRDYATTCSEQAFAQLVQQHLDLVYFAALRRCAGDSHRAEDVTQQVFTTLARKAASLVGHRVLAGWLYVTTRNVAANLMRAEQTRRAQEAEAHAMSEALTPSASSPPDSAPVEWDRLRPALDGVMDQLAERDRDAVLLRFFENRPFREIGTALRVTEDAARMRVDRALDKLRVLLERRGITSSSAALGAALAKQAAFAKPAGLAASVTNSALAGAGATALGGITALGLMSMVKISAGAAALGVLLVVSLAGNAWMLLHLPAQAAARQIEPVASTPSLVPETSVPPALVKSADLAALLDQMRSAGASDASIRATLHGILRRRYREQLSTDTAARLQRGWWRDHARTWGTANDVQLPVDDLWLMKRMVAQPLEDLLGVDPLDAAHADARYAFLPPELRQEFGRLDRASIGGWSRSGQPEIDAVLEAELERQRNLVTEQRKALLASLTSTQRSDYEMRFGEFASGLRRQLQPVAVTEQEFRTVFPIAEQYASDHAALSRQEYSFAAYAELDARAAEKIVAAIGYERALDYIWAGSPEYAAIARVARDSNLPPTTASSVVQLAAETAHQAIAIHEDTATSAEEKRSALAALQVTVRSRLDALLPIDAQQRAAPHALAWYHALNEGRYKTIWTAMPGLVRTFGGGSSIAVAEPISAHRVKQLVPRRPGGN